MFLTPLKKISGFFAFGATLVFLFSPVAISYAQSASSNDACSNTSITTLTTTPGLTPDQQKAEWQKEYDQLNADIAACQDVLNTTKAGTASLQRDAALLTAKINQAKALIKQKNIAIAQLDQDIAAKNAHILTLEQQIEQGHESLAQIIRKTNELDQYSLPEVMLTNKTISDFFSDVDSFKSVNQSMATLFAQIRATENLTQQEKDALQVQQNKEADTKAAAQLTQARVTADEKQKEYLIQINKTQEKTYAQVIADKQKHAAEIRAALFSLKDTGAIPFGTAYQYALDAQKSTGIDPAFLLAIFAQESGRDSSGTFGQNTGSCYLKDDQSGAGIGANSGTVIAKVMSPTRDVPPFLSLMSELGYDPHNTKISCPQSVGWGGAMGPAQFIPSTWALFSDRISSANGDRVPDPWNAKDAFMAAALYLTDLGAIGNSASAQKTAACKYYSGQKCSSSSYANSYGSSVLAKAQSIQTTMIDPLSF